MTFFGSLTTEVYADYVEHYVSSPPWEVTDPSDHYHKVWFIFATTEDGTYQLNQHFDDLGQPNWSLVESVAYSHATDIERKMVDQYVCAEHRALAMVDRIKNHLASGGRLQLSKWQKIAELSYQEREAEAIQAEAEYQEPTQYGYNDMSWIG